ncbi:MAG: GNAT family N-acetyltransferase [Lachnospiraceae bacterium]|nr:GNAT family N-acetyltransferase [Lachnospiraceae bacterium]
MESRFLPLSGEDKRLLISEDGKQVAGFILYPISENEAEFTPETQDIVKDENDKNGPKISENIICEMRNTLLEAFSAIKKEGYEKVEFTLERSSPIYRFVLSTEVVKIKRSEYFMKLVSLKDQQQDNVADGEKPEYKEQNRVTRVVSPDFKGKYENFLDGIYLYGVNVPVKYRRKGCATRRIKEIFYKNDKKPIYVHVSGENVPARQLYLKLGFEDSEVYDYLVLAEDGEKCKQ